MMPIPVSGKIYERRAKFPARVLIVDDEPLICWSLSTGLRQAGFDAITASSASEAVRITRERPHPDVLLLDVRLFGIDWMTLLAELRSIAPDCRFLVLATAGQEVPTFSRNGITIVEKPFDLADVVRLVHAITDPAGAACAASSAARRTQ